MRIGLTLKNQTNHNGIKRYKGLDFPPAAGRRIVAETKRHFGYVNLLDATFAPLEESHWSKKANTMRDEIWTLNEADDVINYSQSQCGFDHRARAEDWQPFLKLYDDRLKYEFPQRIWLIDSLGDSRYSKADTLLEYENRPVSNVFYFHMREMLQCLTYIPHAYTICEIGGGYGDLARLFMWYRYSKENHYILVDLPETLFFAEVYLKVNGLKCLYITSSNALNDSDLADYDIILCPITFRDSLNKLPIGLIINTGSFGELSKEWLDSWVDWIDKQGCRWFYSVNYFGQPIGDLQEGESPYSILFPSNWVAKLLSYNPAYFMLQSPRNFAEMILFRQDSAPSYQSSLDRYEQSKGRILDGQGLLECMDIIRNDSVGDITFDLLERCLAQDVVRKEEFVLLERLKRYPIYKERVVVKASPRTYG